jgi:hypothetical protein
VNKISNPFEKLLVSLVEERIQFITVGGIACAFNGYVRATEDVDILIKRTSDNIQRLLKFLSHYGEGFGAELALEDFSDEEGAIRVIEEFPIDIFVVMSGKHFEDFEKEVEWISIQGKGIPYLSRSGLIALKKDSIREKDQMDVLALKNENKGSSH